jgi:putative FmdB family regulatory protein
MPMYDFYCDQCGDFAALRTVAARDEACACPACGAAARRVLSLPALSLMSATARTGHQINERSAHAPQRSGEYAHRHGPGCGCSSGSKAAAAAKPGALKTNAGGRPWMISH